MLISIRRNGKETIDCVRRSWNEMIASDRRRLAETIDVIRRMKIVSSMPGSQIVMLRHKERKTRKNLLLSKSP